MSTKKTTTPKEIPLHEVVLRVMFEANKERPAKLTIEEVFQNISDAAINEANVSDVLNWLVVQKQVELETGKYLLDRYEFLEQRAKDKVRNGEKEILITEDNPLHEVILSLMFKSNTKEPAKLSQDDVYWMVSDSKVQVSHVGDVLNWLLSQGRIEYLGGMYALDGIEFQDQKVKNEKQPTKKKVQEKPKPKKKTGEKKPKIVIPSSKEETPKQSKKTTKPEDKVEQIPKIFTPSAEEEIKVVPKKKVEETPPPPNVKKAEEIKSPMPVLERTTEVNEPVNSKWRMPILVAFVICVVYTFYLLFVLNETISSDSNAATSRQVKQELISVRVKLNELSDEGSSNQGDISYLKEKVESLEDLAQVGSEANAKDSQNERSINLLTRLTVALCFAFILITFLFFITKKAIHTRKS